MNNTIDRSISCENLSFIFTSHSMLPKAESELQAVLETQNPESIFVEISPEDLRKNEIDGYPLEMLFALKWGQNNSKTIFGFDCGIQTISETVSESGRKIITARYLEYSKGRSWRDLNDPSVARHGISISQGGHDPEKLELRRSCMKQNILRFLPEGGKALVLTGGFHSEYFRREFQKAKFPLTPV